MSARREIFRFVQLRNTKKPPPPEPIEIVPKTLEFDNDRIIALFDLDETNSDLAQQRAAEFLVEAAQNRAMYLLLQLLTLGVRRAANLDVERLDQQVTSRLKSAGITPQKMAAFETEAAIALACCKVIGSQAALGQVLAENTLRGIAITRALVKRGTPEIGDLKGLAVATIELNEGDRETPAARNFLRDTPSTARVSKKKVQAPGLFGGGAISKKGPMTIPYKGGLLTVSGDPKVSAYGGAGVPSSVGTPRQVSVGDLILSEETNVTYDYGEIAYVENVLQTESRERTHEIRTSEEEMDYEEAEVIETSVTELKTTEQQDLQEAFASVTGKETSTTASVGMTASYGPVSASASAGASGSTTQQQSNNRATNFAKEVTNSAVEELTSRVKTTRQTSTRVVVSEANRHGFDNTRGTGHVVGIYRYLNRIVDTQLVNYGERLMLEFVVPEPAAHYVYALANSTSDGLILEAPEPFLLSPEEINDRNYRDPMETYDVQSLPEPPLAEIILAHDVAFEAADTADYHDIYKESEAKQNPDLTQPYKRFDTGSVTIDVPEGYAATSILITAAYTNLDPSTDEMVNEWMRFACNGWKVKVANKDDEREKTLDLTGEKGEGPIAIAWAGGVRYGSSVSIKITCERQDSAYEAWRTAVWTEINNAYLSKQSAYDNQLAYAQSSAPSYEDNPLLNRETERTELKRGVLTLLTDQDFSLFGSVDALVTGQIDTAEALIEGEYIRFFEESVEWHNMAISYYDYAWAGRHRWLDLMGRVSDDLEHQAFLRAGAARVIVPVTPGHEIAMLDFLDNGQIWDGESELELSSSHVLYDEIMELIEEPRDEGSEVISTDTVTLPTNLVILQQGPDPNDPSPVGPIETPSGQAEGD